MTAPLVQRLELARSQATSPFDRAEIEAEIACYEARIGEFEAAERRRSELRREFGDGRSPRVSIRLMCLDALLLFFKDLSSEARDRMARAKLISNASRDNKLVSLTSAWLAHIDFNEVRFESMASNIAESLGSMPADDGSAKLRVSLVLGDALLFAGLHVESKAWYEQARRIASTLGDQAAFGAITYNRAALHVASARYRGLRDAIPESELKLIQGEVSSAINYQAGARLKSLDHLLLSAQVGALVLSGDFQLALEKCELLIASDEVPKNSAELAQAHADLALCRAKLGLPERDLLSVTAHDSFAADDLAVLLHTYVLTKDACGVPSDSDLMQQVEVARKAHEETLVKLRELLVPYLQVSKFQ